MTTDISSNGKKSTKKKPSLHTSLSRALREKIKTNRAKYQRNQTQEIEFCMGVYYKIQMMPQFQALLNEAEGIAVPTTTPKDTGRHEATQADI